MKKKFNPWPLIVVLFSIAIASVFVFKYNSKPDDSEVIPYQNQNNEVYEGIGDSLEENNDVRSDIEPPATNDDQPDISETHPEQNESSDTTESSVPVNNAESDIPTTYPAQNEPSPIPETKIEDPSVHQSEDGDSIFFYREEDGKNYKYEIDIRTGETTQTEVDASESE